MLEPRQLPGGLGPKPEQCDVSIHEHRERVSTISTYEAFERIETPVI